MGGPAVYLHRRMRQFSAGKLIFETDYCLCNYRAVSLCALLYEDATTLGLRSSSHNPTETFVEDYLSIYLAHGGHIHINSANTPL